MSRPPRVAVLRTRPDTVLEDYATLLDLAGYRDALDSSCPTILKDNISWHFPLPGANTTPWQMEGATLALRSAGYKDLVCVENRTVVTNTEMGAVLNRLLPVLQKHTVPVLRNYVPGDMEWIRYQPKTRMLALDRVFPEGILIPEYFMGKNVVHLPTMKCHVYTTTTGAMKNAFGGLLDDRRHRAHSWIHETLVDLLAIQHEIHPGVFAVMDGTTAGNGPGPRTLRPEVKGVILASADQVAIDAVAASMMGFDPMSIGYIRLAHEAGLGTGRIDEIEIAGDLDAARESWGFRVGGNGAGAVGRLLWFSPLQAAQRLLFQTPLVHLFALGSSVYHDRYRWPAREHRLYDRWLHSTGWGRLFQQYEQY